MERASGVAVLTDGVSRLFPPVVADDTHPLDGILVSLLVIPITARGATIGAVAVASSPPLAVSPEFRRVLGALLYYVSLAADRLRLEQTSQAVEALREADRLKNAVLASVSHDLRTPLTTIIAQEAARLNRFVGDLLDVSRLTSGGMSVRPEVVPADELVSAALQQVEGAFPDRRIQVELQGGDPLLLGLFDPLQSVRILVNLLENAHKYSPAGTPVDLSVHRDAEWLVFRVSDRGPGVQPEEMERIFEPLYRPADARPDAGSSGLGLAIARGFTEAQGGSLTYAARAGGGSVFTVRLPSADTPLT
jgi:two-component system sensor histidine kinase KdpD